MSDIFPGSVDDCRKIRSRFGHAQGADPVCAVATDRALQPYNGAEFHLVRVHEPLPIQIGADPTLLRPQREGDRLRRVGMIIPVPSSSLELTETDAVCRSASPRTTA